MNPDRRAILLQAVRISALAPIALAGGLPLALGCSREGARCYDPEQMSTSELALRRSRRYVDVSAQGDAEACGGCEFFRAGESEGCGHCELLGGPVSTRGRCDAWAARTSG